VTFPTETRITSPANARIKAAARLRDRRARERSGLTLVDGARELLRAFAAGTRIREVFACPELAGSGDAELALARLEEHEIEPTLVTPPVFAKLAFGERAEGLVAVVEVPSTALSSVHLPPEPLVLVAEALEKPGNLGAVIRTADGAGADAVVAASPRTDLFNPNAVRASLGTIFAVPLAAAPTAHVQDWLRGRGLRIVAATPAAERLATDANLTGPLAIVVGAEAEGLDASWTAPDVEAVRIPMLGVADSLNVAAAAAVLLYEARRQRGLPGAAGTAR
jgi:TrmH family RNA methyltransferase